MMGEVLNDQPITPGEGILHHPEGVDLMPSDIQLSGMEVSLVNAMSRETILRQYLNTVRKQYTHILLDCQPSLGIRDGWDNMNFVPGTARKVLAQYSPERVFFVLAYTVREREYDTRITGHNQSWAKTVPLYGMKSGRGDCTLESHSTKVDLFIDAVQHDYLLSLPLKREDIKAEAQSILTEFQTAGKPNSPNGTHYMAQVSPDFLARAKTKDHDRLMDTQFRHSQP